MIVREPKTKKKVGPMQITEYKINEKFSAALIKINGDHGAIKCIAEDRIYFVIEGSGDFIIDNKTIRVKENDLVFIPMNTPYNVTGKMKYIIVCSPAFDPKHDVRLG